MFGTIDTWPQFSIIPVDPGKFTSCQLFLLYLAAPFLTASRLFLFGLL